MLFTLLIVLVDQLCSGAVMIKSLANHLPASLLLTGLEKSKIDMKYLAMTTSSSYTKMACRDAKI